MSNDHLDPETIDRISRSFTHAFDAAAQEPATAEVAGVLSVSVDSTFRVSRVVLAHDLVGDEVRERIESAIATAVNEAYQQMAMRHAGALRAALEQDESKPGPIA